MPKKVTVIYNDPASGNHRDTERNEAIDGVLDSVNSVRHALEQMGCFVSTRGLKLTLLQKELGTLDGDMVFNLFEGFEGYQYSEVFVAHVLERNGLCFTGAPSISLFHCEDKSAAKQILKARGIPTPDWQVLSPSMLKWFDLEFPCIVKPLGEHASLGLSEKSVVSDIESLKEQVDIIWKVFKRPSLVEKYLCGREFRALVVGNSSLTVFPIEEIIYSLPPDKPKLLTYHAKWLPGHEYFLGTGEKCPAEIESVLQHQIEETATLSYKALECRGYASIDMRQDDDGKLMVIDVNPNTDISAIGGVQYPIAAAGMDYTSFIALILQLATNSPELPIESEAITFMADGVK
jgi:D-alanine-D-alanine ligase